MKMLAKSALGVAVAAVIATTSVQAGESVTMDPSLDLSYKNYYWIEDDKGNGGYERNEWVHALIADFDSGYVNDMIGAVVTAGYAGPLSVESNSSISNVAKGSDGKGSSVTGFQQAYVKAKFGDDSFKLGLTAGVKKRGTALYGDSGSRLLAASSNGVDLTASFSGLDLYASRIQGASARNASAFSRDLTFKGGKVDSVTIVGANVDVAGVKLSGEYGKSDKVAVRTFLKAAYTFDLGNGTSLDLDARYGTAKEDGRLGAAVLGEGYKSKYANANGTFSFGNAYVGLGYNATGDGDYLNRFVDGNNDKFNSSLSQWEAYAEAGERAYLINGGYNFADQGLAGLNWDLWYANGSDADGIDDFKRREYGSSVGYSFDGDLKGLSVKWLHINYRASGGTAAQQAGITHGLYNENINRFYMTYKVSAF